MKTLSVPVEGLTLKQLLKKAARQDVVFLTTGGEMRYALVPADEGDQEICALRSNTEFLAYLGMRLVFRKAKPTTAEAINMSIVPNKNVIHAISRMFGP